MLEASPEAAERRIITAQIADFKSANVLSHALAAGDGEGELYKLAEQSALSGLID